MCISRWRKVGFVPFLKDISPDTDKMISPVTFLQMESRGEIKVIKRKILPGLKVIDLIQHLLKLWGGDYGKKEKFRADHFHFLRFRMFWIRKLGLGLPLFRDNVPIEAFFAKASLILKKLNLIGNLNINHRGTALREIVVFQKKTWSNFLAVDSHRNCVILHSWISKHLIKSLNFQWKS